MKNPKVLQGQLIIQRAPHHFWLKKALSGILLVVYMNISFLFSFQQVRNEEGVENEVMGRKKKKKTGGIAVFCKTFMVFSLTQGWNVQGKPFCLLGNTYHVNYSKYFFIYSSRILMQWMNLPNVKAYSLYESKMALNVDFILFFTKVLIV